MSTCPPRPDASLRCRRIGHLLPRPVGRPPQKSRVFFASFSYQAQSWSKPRRVVAKVEWHRGELYPRVGFIFFSRIARPEAGRPDSMLPPSGGLPV